MPPPTGTTSDNPQITSHGSTDDKNLFSLPRICYQAAGGDLPWVDHLGLAWFLFYIAAHLMDNVEDQEDPDQLWVSYPAAVRINVASGLFFTAANSLDRIHQNDVSQSAVNEIIADFYSSFLGMCSGQNDDLLHENITLDMYWRIASSKSGGFFGIGSWAGARLATDDTVRLEGFRQFGYNLGIHKQIRDDLEEIQDLENQLIRKDNISESGSKPAGLSKLRRNLPIVYAYEVISEAECNRLDNLLESNNPSLDKVEELIQILDRAGAALYIATELERFRSQALTALEQAAPNSQDKDILASFL